MKIISTLLIVSVTIPLCINLATSSSVDLKELIPGGDDHASVYLITHNISSEPAMMILIGTALIGIAGIGRKIFPRRDNHHKNENKLRSAIPPHPDPVPWKKEE